MGGVVNLIALPPSPQFAEVESFTESKEAKESEGGFYADAESGGNRGNNGLKMRH